MNTKKYKAATPEETVARIKKLLSENHIPVKDLIYGDGDLFCSYRLVIAENDDDTIGTNGKGMTPPYAQASAYAEMMERFQNRVVIYPNPANHRSSYMFFPDETKRSLNAEQATAVIQQFTPRVLPECGIKEEIFDCIFLPFYHVNSGKEVNLPYSLIRWVNGSNGMCAGNIPEEALIQGFNEIFERYTLQEMYLRKLTPPNIPKEIFTGTNVLNNLERMKLEYGMDYQIKDCSLGEGFPAIGLMVYNPDKSKYIAHYGADLSLRVALERCFTEIFQGHTANTLLFDNDINSCESLDLFNEFKRSLVYGRGRMPVEFFENTPSYAFNMKSYIPAGQNFKEDLSNIISWLKERGNDIYIRDNSFLGFPAYHICIPGMSDINKAFCDLNARIFDKQHTENNISPLWKLPLLNNEELKTAIKLIEKTDKNVISLAPHNRNKGNNVNRLLILMLAYYKLGDDTTALNYLNKYIIQKEKEEKPIQKYYYAIRNLLEGQPIPQQPDRNWQIAANFLKNRNNALYACPLPVCYNCEKCELSDGCRYQFLLEIEHQTQHAMAKSKIRQIELSSIFQ